MNAPAPVAAVTTRAGAPEERLTVASIIERVAEHCGVGPRDITGPRRYKELVTARHLAMWLSYRLLRRSSYPSIAKAFCRQDHTTVLHAVRKLDAELAGRDPRAVWVEVCGARLTQVTASSSSASAL